VADDKDPRASIRSKLQQYPAEVLDRLDVEIAKGYGAMSCMKVVQTQYSGPNVLPSRDTFEKWVAERRKYFKVQAERRLHAEQQFINLPPVPPLNKIHPDDKRQWLSAVLRTLGERVERLKTIQENADDPRYERVLTDDLLGILDAVEKQVELEKKMGFDRERLQVVAQVLLGHISKAVGQAYKDVHGDDKFESFLKALDKRTDSLSYEVIEAEVVAAADNTRTIDVEAKK
jgi:hypothetical protein